MSNIDRGDLFAEIGGLLVLELTGPVQNLLLYAKLEPGVITAEIFQGEESQIVYHVAGDELTDRIEDLWYAEEEGKRWKIMLYRVQGATFDVDLLYPDQIDENEYHGDFRERLVIETLGDKPIFYPPWDDED